jgi:DNA-directed RNA polymerase subunit RPC12/RpoP
MEDKLIKCEHCGSDMCYATPINETAWSYSCTGCGFNANDLMKEGEFDLEQFEEILPELYKDLKYVDDKKRIWYPLVVQNETGIVFVDGSSKENWGWGAIKNRPLTEEEKQIFINENKEVPPYKSDSSTLEHFGKMGFLKALNYIEVI